MPETETRNDSKHKVTAMRVVLLVVMFVVLVIYPLSVGPALGLCCRLDAPGAMEAEVFIAYLPVILVFCSTEPSRELFNWYIELWQPPERSFLIFDSRVDWLP